MRRTLQAARNLFHILFPVLGAIRYGIPGRKLRVIGITGTDGKSSTVLLTAAILRAQGYRVVHYSSISTHDGEIEMPNTRKMTMPGRMELHRFLAMSAKKGATHAVVEVTSEGIRQNRHRMVGFAAVAVTNITPEHIESHGSFARYRRAKLSLFRHVRAGGAIVLPEHLAEELSPLKGAGKVFVVGTDASSFVQEADAAGDMHGSTVRIIRGQEEVRIESKLGGPFAVSNMLMATGIASVFGVPLGVVKTAIEGVSIIPGRFEVLSRHPLVIVDYAHTLKALGELLPFVRAHSNGRLIHVFGAAGGGRDRYKRPLLAKISGENADVSIISEENPFDEDPKQITSDILAGFSDTHDVRVVPVREEAAALALTLAGKGDTVLLTAKGSETRIAGVHGSFRPYNERTYVRCLLGTS